MLMVSHQLLYRFSSCYPNTDVQYMIIIGKSSPLVTVFARA